MRLPRSLSDAVALANWCRRECQEPAAVARLIVLARRAHHAGERYCNTGERPRYDAAMGAFDRAAAALGYTADWPGLWPVLNREGIDVYLPDVG